MRYADLVTMRFIDKYIAPYLNIPTRMKPEGRKNYIAYIWGDEENGNFFKIEVEADYAAPLLSFIIKSPLTKYETLQLVDYEVPQVIDTGSSEDVEAYFQKNLPLIKKILIQN